MARTFDDLGIPFPLFAAPVEEAAEYLGIERCRLCTKENHVFRVGIGGYLISACPHCGSDTGIHVADNESECVSCHRQVANVLGEKERVAVCYACLRGGKAALTKDTVFGMIRWEDAVQGSTHGVPGAAADPPPPHRVFNVGVTGDVSFDPSLPPRVETPWVRKALPQEVMFELLRTPSYSTWQGEQWQFDGDAPMVYLGTWGRADFDAQAEDGDGQALFRRLVEGPPPGDWTGWLGEQSGDHGIVVYVFRSRDGGRLAAHYDMD